MSAAVTDKKTREQWVAEFSVWGASKRLDLEVCFVDGVPYFLNEVVERMLHAYMVGRLHQIDAGVAAAEQKRLDAIARHDLGGA